LVYTIKVLLALIVAIRVLGRGVYADRVIALHCQWS